MITGYNTDVEHDGIIYHVQTEDKGVETPLMLSLVYTGGEILASKRVRYDDLIAEGFDESVLATRLLRQHKLICAAIRAGRLEELKRMTERDSPSRSSPRTVDPPPDPTPPVQPTEQFAPSATARQEVTAKPVLPRTQDRRLPSPTKRSERFVPVAIPETVASSVSSKSPTLDSIHLVLVDERIYRGGNHVVLCVRVENGADQRQIIAGADVIVKILGSTFRPLIYQTKSSVDGIAVVTTDLPHFRSGRAAILIRVTVGDLEAELRRIIQQG